MERQQEQHIHFCRTQDGVNIAYAAIGSGPPLVKTANWLSHLEFDWQSPVWRHWLAGLSRHHRLIRYDERGCGLSDWDISIDNLGRANLFLLAAAAALLMALLPVFKHFTLPGRDTSANRHVKSGLNSPTSSPTDTQLTAVN